MKKFVKPFAFILAAIAVSISLPAFAGPKRTLPYPHARLAGVVAAFNVKLTHASMEEVLNLQVENTGGKRLTVKLTDPEGNTQDLFNISKDIYRANKPYNFTTADEGVYTLVVTDGVNKVVKQIKLHRTAVVHSNIAVE